MRNLLLSLVVVGGVATYVRAETLYLNSAQVPVPTTETTLASHPNGGQPAGQVCTSCQNNYGGQYGLTGQYPGGCCERDASCCAALWANYCQEKKPCWTPESPRRHVVGCGIPLPSLPSLPHGWLGKHCSAAAEPCDDQASCAAPACDALSCDLNVAAPGDDLQPPAVELDPAAADVDAAGDATQPAPPELDPSAKRKGLPFGWKLPKPGKSNLFKTSPTARLKLPFSR